MASTTEPVCVTISALDAGHLTLPERIFITDADPEKRATEAPPPTSSSTCKRDLTGYPPAQQSHIANRRPITVDPDCAASLRAGGLDDTATDIDLVLLSHVHWDHVGTPSDFSSAAFVVGSGTQALLKDGAGPLYPAEIFNDDEVPAARTAELPPVPDRVDVSGGLYVEPAHTPALATATALLPAAAKGWEWKRLAAFPAALDFFGDGSLWVIDSPGHLYGHVNAIARVGPGRYVYLGGDCCHDPRIPRGERGIALYDDGRGGKRSVHVHTGVARQTLDWIDEFVKSRKLDGEGEVEVEVVVAHDGEWRAKNKGRFWPGCL